MAIKKSDLYSSLWASCDELRGGMDASQYKDYVLFMLFIKYISDKYGASSDFAPPVVIPRGASFTDMVALKGKSDIGDRINTQVIQPLIEANARLARSDFPDFNDPNKLGEGKAMVDRLSELVAFSCKKKGVCPSCLGRRMADTAVHLEQSVLPRVPIRHWICSLPWGLRALLGYDRKLCAEVVSAFMAEVDRSLRWRAKRELGLASVADAHTGGVVAAQRTDSALRLNVHMHALELDGVYVHENGDSRSPLEFRELRTPTQADIAEVAARTATRIEKILRAHGRDRRRVETLCKYITRPPVTQDRLERRADGKLELSFKRPGATARARSCSSQPTSSRAWSPRCLHRAGTCSGILGRSRVTRRDGGSSCPPRRPTSPRTGPRPPAATNSSCSAKRTTRPLRASAGLGCSRMCSRPTSRPARAAQARCVEPRSPRARPPASRRSCARMAEASTQSPLTTRPPSSPSTSTRSASRHHHRSPVARRRERRGSGRRPRRTDNPRSHAASGVQTQTTCMMSALYDGAVASC